MSAAQLVMGVAMTTLAYKLGEVITARVKNRRQITQVDMRILKPKKPFKLGGPEDFLLDIELQNRLGVAIPGTAEVILLESAYHHQTSVVVGKSIPDRSWSTITLPEIAHKDSARLDTLPSVFKFEIKDGNAVLGVAEVEVDFNWFTGLLHPGDVDVNGDALMYNILNFGEAGTGKTTSIQSMLTMIRGGKVLTNMVVPGGQAGHGSRVFMHISLASMGCPMALRDTWGVTSACRSFPELERILDGAIPDRYEMTDAPEQSAEAIRRMQQQLDNIMHNNLTQADEQQNKIHAVLFFVSHRVFRKNATIQTQLIPAFKSLLKRIVDKHYCPLVVIPRVDEVDPTMLQHPDKPTKEVTQLLERAAAELDVQVNQVTYLINYRKEKQRVFAIDKVIYKVALEALEQARTFYRKSAAAPEQYAARAAAGAGVAANARH